MFKLQTLKSTLPVLDTHRVQKMQAGSWRISDQTEAQRGYGYKWQKAREQFLREHPLCVMYQVQGRIEAATVVGYITPHRGDQSLCWRRSNWQPLCATNVGRNRQSLDKLRQRIVSVSQEASAATGLAKRAASWTSWVGSSEARVQTAVLSRLVSSTR